MADMNYDKSLFSSFGYAAEGIWHAFGHNRNLRIDLFVAIAVILVSLYLRISIFEMVLILITILLVVSSEMINTSLEEMVNLITNEHRREAKVAKDVAAGMVLISAIGSVVIGIIIFLPHILRLFN